jgi:hypothetical protein
MFKRWMKDAKLGGLLNNLNKPQLFGNTRKLPWTSLIKESNAHLVSTSALNLLDGLLCFDPKARSFLISFFSLLNVILLDCRLFCDVDCVSSLSHWPGAFDCT